LRHTFPMTRDILHRASPAPRGSSANCYGKCGNSCVNVFGPPASVPPTRF
jgi:hypothetical protein